MPLLLNLLPARFLLTLREWFDYKISHCVLIYFSAILELEVVSVRTLIFPLATLKLSKANFNLDVWKAAQNYHHAVQTHFIQLVSPLLVKGRLY